MPITHVRRPDSLQAKEASSTVIRLSLKGVQPIDAQTWAQIEAAAREPRKGRRYPEILEAPDASL